ncbi:putative rubber elongation factor [Rosa chinensis]|uniref:Putative rubber elongation factor n=1 Tax=Rosa chinensis TaxID=74649 RepID=A0A2P6PWP3_ROSCH|nr:stress-related protein [Rosa chinensis]PRQ26352.1 putative rubber elongation factor [Rosa chinensis]
MADPESSRPIDTVNCDEKKLKYLEFVEVAAIYAVLCFSSLYEYAKENAGPLKPGVQTVEGTVKTVIGPVYEKFQDLPFQLLKFVDHKVDESLSELHRHVPFLVKQASNTALSVATEVKRAGLVDAARNITASAYSKYEPMAEEVYYKYEPVAEQYAVSAWRSLNRLPLVPQVAQIMVPTAAYWSEKYNQAVCFTAERGFPVAAHLPLIPTERIAKAFEEAEHVSPAGSTNAGAVELEH